MMAIVCAKLWFGMCFISIVFKYTRGALKPECVRYTDSLPWRSAVDQCLSWGGKVASYNDNATKSWFFDLPQIPGQQLWTGDYQRTITKEGISQDTNGTFLCAFVEISDLHDVYPFFIPFQKNEFRMSQPAFEDCLRWNKALCYKEDKEYLTATDGEHPWTEAMRQCVLWDGLNAANYYLGKHFETSKKYWIQGVREQNVVKGSFNITDDIAECGVYGNAQFSFTTECDNTNKSLTCVLSTNGCDLSTTTGQLRTQPSMTSATEVNWDTTTTNDINWHSTASDASHQINSSDGSNLHQRDTLPADETQANTGLIVGVVVGTIGLLGVAVVVLILLTRRRRRKEERNGGTEASNKEEKKCQEPAGHANAVYMNHDINDIIRTQSSEDGPVYEMEDISEFGNGGSNVRTDPNCNSENICEYANVPTTGMHTGDTGLNTIDTDHGIGGPENDHYEVETNNYIYSESSKVRDNRHESGNYLQSQDAANVYNTTNTSNCGSINNGDMYDRTNSGQLKPVCSNREEYSSLGVPIEDNVYNRTFEATIDRKSEIPDSVYNRLQMQEDEYNVAMPTRQSTVDDFSTYSNKHAP